MIRLRPAEPQDSWLFFELRNDPQVIANSPIRQGGPLTKAQHDEWWEKVFEHRYVAYDGPACVGVIRIGQHEPGLGVISIIVAPQERGKGMGTGMLKTIKRVAREEGYRILIAHVLPTNEASQKAFLSANWEPVVFFANLEEKE